MKFLRSIAAALALLLMLPLQAQRQDYYLGDAPWYLKHSVGQKTLQQCWVTDSGRTVSYVKANIYPQLFARLNGSPFNWPDSMVMKMNVGPAAHNEAVLKGQGGGQPITGRVTSNNGVEWPAGIYAVNYPCIVDGGDYRGQGTGFSGTVGGAVSMNTNLVYNHTGWLGSYGGAPFDVRNLIQTCTWGILTGATAYTESGTVRDFRLTGNNGSWWDPTYTSNGLGMWDLGETWYVERIFAETFNGYGVMNVRGTPATYNVISSFQNALGGIGLIGTELNTINITTLSGDDNPALIVMQAGYGRGSGGTVSVTLAKSESGKRTPNKGQIILWQRSPSYGNINISVGQGDMNGNFLDAQFVVNNNTAAAGQMVTVQYRGWNGRTTFHDVSGQMRWPQQNYRPECLTYTYRGGVTTLFDCATGQVLPSSPVNATDRLGMVANNGTFDYANGTPVYSITGGVVPPPPPPTCVWNVGPWGPCSPCVAGECTQTRSVTSSVVGCTPTDPQPAATQTLSCGTPPPGPTPLFSRTPFNNTNPNASIDLVPDVPGVKRIVLTNVTFNLAAFNYQRILVSPGSTAGLRAVPLSTSGTGSTRCKFRLPNGQDATTTPTTVSVGTFYPTLEILLPTAITVDRLLGTPNSGASMILTCEKIEGFSQ